MPDPWGSDPRDRFVLVRSAIASDGLCHSDGAHDCADSLPISRALIERIERWSAWHDDEEDKAWGQPPSKGMGGDLLHWEQHPGAPTAAFNAEARAIGHALKAELPPDWTVLVADIDGWLRTDEPWEKCCLVLPANSEAKVDPGSSPG